MQEVQQELEVVQGELEELKSDSALGQLQTKFEEADAEREGLSEEVTELRIELDATTEERDEFDSELKKLKVRVRLGRSRPRRVPWLRHRHVRRPRKRRHSTTR